MQPFAGGARGEFGGIEGPNDTQNVDLSDDRRNADRHLGA
jgi:hypothetical protein